MVAMTESYFAKGYIKMANASNKHKAQGKKPVVKQESWWTLEHIKYVCIAAVVVVLIALAVGIFNYVSGLQDSVVGTWSNKYEDPANGEAMEVLFTFNDDMTCSFIRNREGEPEANMSGSYSIDDNYDVISLMLGVNYDTVLQYYYECDGDELVMINFTTGTEDLYVKVAE